MIHPVPKPTPNSRRKGSRVEREIARLTGARRTPLSGAVGGGDITGGRLGANWSVEVKARKQLTSIYRWLDQAGRDIGLGDSRKPMAICKQDRSRPIAICYLADLLAALDAAGPDQAAEIRAQARSIVKAAGEIERLAR